MKKADFNKASGTSYMGSVKTTYNRLVEIFGEPHLRDGDKTTAEWVLEFQDGTIATIYDWKLSETPTYEYNWHVGGFSKDAVDKVNIWVNFRPVPPGVLSVVSC